MHIPPYHKKAGWQRFFAGVFFGGIIAYFILLYMYGTMYEELIAENLALTSELSDLKLQNQALLSDKEDLTEKSQQPLTVSTIEVTIENNEQIKMDLLIEQQLEDMLKEEINHLIGQEIAIVTKSDQLLISTIENKRFTVDEITYFFDVRVLTIATELKIIVSPKLSD